MSFMIYRDKQPGDTSQHTTFEVQGELHHMVPVFQSNTDDIHVGMLLGAIPCVVEHHHPDGSIKRVMITAIEADPV